MSVDLNADHQDEFVLIMAGQAFAYTRSGDGQWRRAGQMTPVSSWDREKLLQQLLSGDFAAREPAWRELRVGRSVLRLDNY